MVPARPGGPEAPVVTGSLKKRQRAGMQEGATETTSNLAAAEDPEILCELVGLSTWFHTDGGTVKAVGDVSYRIPRGQTVGLVGESGCGKSVTSLSIMRLIPDPPGKIVAGEILFKGKDLLKLPEREMRKIRGNDIAMIFQEPQSSLNPVFTIGAQIIEAIVLHQRLSRREARERAIEMLELVGIPSPRSRIDEYPHQLSGGMKQRAMIAMALSCNPELLIADEPTTALDVTIQAQILELMKGLQQKFGMSILLITHDLGVVAEMVDHVVVMYASRVVEHGTAKQVFETPVHPYTRGLFRSIPKLGAGHDRLETIEGTVPNPLHFPTGCKFHDRCREAKDICKTDEPLLVEKAAGGHLSACHMRDDHAEGASSPGGSQ